MDAKSNYMGLLFYDTLLGLLQHFTSFEQLKHCHDVATCKISDLLFGIRNIKSNYFWQSYGTDVKIQKLYNCAKNSHNYTFSFFYMFVLN